MKQLLYLWLLWPLTGLGQVKPDFVRTPNGSNTIVDWNAKFKTLILPKWLPGLPPLYQGRDTIGGIFVSTDAADRHLYVKQNDGNYTAIANLNDVTPATVSPFTVTHVPALGESIAGGTPDQTLKQLFNQTQAPIASLSGGFAQERVAPGGALSGTVSWGAARNTNTNPLNPQGASPGGIVVAGVSQAYTQPAQGGTAVTGTQAVSYARNTTTTFTNTVTTTDGKAASASTSFSFYDKRYAGFDANALAGGLPQQADVLAATYQDNNGASAALSQATAQQGSNKYYFYIAKGVVSSVTINGIPATAAFNLNIPVTFTNASGGTFSGFANVSVNPFGANQGGNTIVFN